MINQLGLFISVIIALTISGKHRTQASQLHLTASITQSWFYYKHWHNGDIYSIMSCSDG